MIKFHIKNLSFVLTFELFFMWLLVGIIIAVAMPLSYSIYLVRQRSNNSSIEEYADDLQRLSKVNEEAISIIIPLEKYIDEKAVNDLKSKCQALSEEIEKERETLKNIEDTLKSAQDDIIQRESKQQELKISKKEDINKIDEINSKFEIIDDEYSKLNQTLKDTMADIDSLIAQLEGNKELQSIFIELNQSLKSTQSLMEELRDEYQSIKSRINKLTDQHKNLEDEYSKLVEKQLS